MLLVALQLVVGVPCVFSGMALTVATLRRLQIGSAEWSDLRSDLLALAVGLGFAWFGAWLLLSVHL